MAVSRNSGHRPNGSFAGQFVSRLSRYDLLLAGIPLVLALGLIVGALSAVPFHLGVAAGSLLSALLIADAVYFHPPTESSAGVSPSKSD